MSYQNFLDSAFNLAWQARNLKDHPFGAVLVYQNKLILSAQNSIVTDKDVTQHAELKLVSLASKQLPLKILKKCTLVTSTEPCAMCAGAIYWAGIRKVVFGCSAHTLGVLAGGSLLIPCEHIFSKGVEETFIQGPINEEKYKEVHKGFWN